MNRSILTGGLFSVALVLLGSCGDNNSPQCPSFELDTPQSNKFLIIAAEAPGFLSRPDTIVVYSINKDLFPTGSEFQTVSLIDYVPPLEELLQFDAISLYTVGFLIDGDLIANAIAINATGKIIALNIWPSFVFSSLDRHPEAAKLIANSLMFTAGLLE